MISAGLALRGPVADDLVQLVLIAAARHVVGEPVVGGQLGLAHRRAQPAEHGVLVGGDHHPAAVGGAVDVRRRDALQPGARRAAHHAADVVVGDGGFLDGQTGFGERGVDDLTLTGDGAPVQRGQCALGGEHAGQAVAQRQRQPRGGTAGETVHVPQPAGRLGDRGVPGLTGVRPGLAVPGHPHQDDAPIAFAQHVVTQVPLLQRAGPEVLHDDVGALDQVQEQLPALLGSRRSSVTAFLLRACTVQKKWCPSSSACPQVRSGSGLPGGSILITSAPMSPSSRPANGPEIRVPSSMHPDAVERSGARRHSENPCRCSQSVQIADGLTQGVALIRARRNSGWRPGSRASPCRDARSPRTAGGCGSGCRRRRRGCRSPARAPRCRVRP